MSCPVCEGAFKRYGFTLKDGLKCYLASEKACCPKKVTVESFNATEVKFKTGDGQSHTMRFMDFMKRSWLDRTAYI